MSLRTELCDYLAAVVAGTEGMEDVRVITSVRALDAISRPTIVVQTNSYTKLPEAPLRKRVGNFTVTLISSHQDVGRAEDQLDGLLEVFLPSLFTFGLSWQEATQVSYADTYLAFDIRITSILTPEEEADNG